VSNSSRLKDLAESVLRPQAQALHRSHGRFEQDEQKCYQQR
jgi:hypothetical protein